MLDNPSMKRDSSIVIHRIVGEAQPILLWTLPEPMRTLSWALQGGGFHRTQKIAWVQVGPHDLTPAVCPQTFLRNKLNRSAAADALGFMTSAKIEEYVRVAATVGTVNAVAVVTVGLGNALRAGDPHHASPRVGTINCACMVDQSLSPDAMLEAMVISAEAKTAAVLESGIRSVMTGAAATGTGTDCHAIACLDRAAMAAYAGKHTAIGSAIGAAVFAAVEKGVQRWMQLHPEHPLALDRLQAAMK